MLIDHSHTSQRPAIAVIISAGAEWRAILELFPDARRMNSPFGEWFIDASFDREKLILYIHGGWGKIAAAASAQYVIDRWSPELLVNIGTCGGVAGEIEQGEIVIAERTIVYDIVERMGDGDEAIAHYTCDIDSSWLEEGALAGARRGVILSADRDLAAEELDELRALYGIVVADWESGAIAWVAARNGVRCLIARGVSDLVGTEGGEAYGRPELFEERAREIIRRLVGMLKGAATQL